jgi:hypothetical protein
VRGVIAILAFISAGCASSQAVSDQWTKPGSHDGDLAVDLYICEQWSKSTDHLRDCMAGHGWKEASER